VGGSARALLNKLMSLPETDTSKLAEIGFSMGGSFGLELARDGAPLAAVAAFHAGLQTKSPAEPGKVKAKILEQTGADDPLVPFDQIKAFEEEMTRAGADWQLISYSGTKHGFTNPEAAGNPALAYNKTVDASAYDDSMSVPNRRSTRTPPSRKASVMRGIWFGTYRPGGRRSEREQVVVQRLAVRGAAVARAQAAAGDADIAGERGRRHPIARAPCQPLLPLCIELPPRTSIAGFVVAYRRATSAIRSAAMPVMAARSGSQ
jgi:hypothetical protein